MSYLKGTFSKTHRALPVQSLNVNTEQEKVTFSIVSINDIEIPKFVKLWSQVFRIRYFLFVLFPIFLVFTKINLDEEIFDPLLALFSVLAALLLTLGGLLLSDYWDHMTGVDRVHPELGSQAIQKGWVTAQATKNWSLIYLFLGSIFGLPALWVFPEILFLVGIPSLFLLAAWIWPGLGIKFRKGAELIVFFLFGPLLTVGFQIACGVAIDLEVVFIGFLAGLLLVVLLFLKNFSIHIVQNQAQFQSYISGLKFEKAKLVVEFLWWFFVIMMSCYQYLFHAPEWFLGFVILVILFSLPFVLNLRKLSSPLGSQMQKLVFLGRRMILLTISLWVFQALYYWIVIELSNV